MARTAKKLSQEKLAFALGLSRPAITNWEIGKNLPELSRAAPLAMALGVSTRDILDWIAADPASGSAEDAEKQPSTIMLSRIDAPNILIEESIKNQSVGKRLTALREGQMLTIPDLAQKVAIDVAVLERWEQDDGLPTSDELRQLEEALGDSLVPEGFALSFAHYLREDAQSASGYAEKPNARIAEGDIPIQVDRLLPYIPVYSTAQGGPEGRFEMYSADTIDRIPRPAALAHAKNIYAIFVEGDSMYPAFRAGDPAVINPDRPPSIGDYVVIFLIREDGPEPSGYLKMLVKRTADKVVVEQHNPSKEMTFKVSEIQRMHRVYRPAELLKV